MIEKILTNPVVALIAGFLFYWAGYAYIDLL